MSALNISDHGYSRYLEHSQAMDKYTEKIKNIISRGKEVRPKDNLKKLLRHNFQETKYYRYRDFIAVVSNNTVVTILKYKRNSKEWV